MSEEYGDDEIRQAEELEKLRTDVAELKKQLEIATDLGQKRWLALNEIVERANQKSADRLWILQGKDGSVMELEHEVIKESDNKRCPFCGSNPQVNRWKYKDETIEDRVFCLNENCSLSKRTYPVEEWNTRPLEDAKDAEIARLTKQHEEGMEYAMKYEAKISRLRAELEANKVEYHDKIDSLHEVIEACKAELDRYRWIPVGERLPEHEQNVLIFVNEDGGEVQISDWDDDMGWGFMNNEIVTHWMPLPSAPEEVENG